jgi:hypothetical protein
MPFDTKDQPPAISTAIPSKLGLGLLRLDAYLGTVGHRADPLRSVTGKTIAG